MPGAYLRRLCPGVARAGGYVAPDPAVLVRSGKVAATGFHTAIRYGTSRRVRDTGTAAAEPDRIVGGEVRRVRRAGPVAGAISRLRGWHAAAGYQTVLGNDRCRAGCGDGL